MKLSYSEFITLAQENYSKGGDVAVECWTEKDFNSYTEMFGAITKTKAMKMFRQWKDEEKEQRAMMFGEW